MAEAAASGRLHGFVNNALLLVSRRAQARVQELIEAGAGQALAELPFGASGIVVPSVSLLALMITAGRNGLGAVDLLDPVTRSRLADERKTTDTLLRRQAKSGHGAKLDFIDALASACDLSDLDVQALREELERAEPAATDASAIKLALEQPERPGHSGGPSLIGRGVELLEISRLLREGRRLVTITGAGGTGKTALAREVLHSLTSRYLSAASWVSLEQLEPGGGIAESVLAQLALPLDASTALDQLIETFRRRHALLVLDNCEHVVEAVRELAERLLAACPDVQLLATSLWPLNVRDEMILKLEPLATPPASASSQQEILAAPAVQLFLELAGSRGYELSTKLETLAAVADICRRLDGIPLALLLCVPLLGVREPESLAHALATDLRLVVRARGGDRGRHAALEATIAWSYGLLGQEHQALWRRLSIFPAGFGVEAGLVVATGEYTMHGETLLADLVDKNMLRSSEGAGPKRLSMFETLRAFAASKVTDAERLELRQRFAAWARNFAESVEEGTHRGPDQTSVLRLVDVEHENLRAAMNVAVEAGHHEDAFAVAGALWRYWRVRGYLREGRQLVERLTAAETTPSVARARALCSAGNLACWEQQYEVALALLQEAYENGVRVGDDAWSVPFSLLVSAICSIRANDVPPDDALKRLEASFQYWQNAGDSSGKWLCWSTEAEWHRRRAANEIAGSEEHQYHLRAAAKADQECDSVLDQSSDLSTIARDRVYHAKQAEAEGYKDLAHALYQQSLPMWQRLDDREGLATCLTGLAGTATSIDRAAEYIVRALPIWCDLGAQGGLADAFEQAAHLLDRRSQPREAVEMMTLAVELRPPGGRRLDRLEAERRLEDGIRNSILAVAKERLTIVQRAKDMRREPAAAVQYAISLLQPKREVGRTP